MKNFAVLLSIYILVFNFAPCEDNSSLMDNVNIELSQDTDNEHSDFDFCSPFCQCNCCHIQVTHFNKANLTNAITELSTEVFFHLYGLEKDYYNTILQPSRA